MRILIFSILLIVLGFKGFSQNPSVIHVSPPCEKTEKYVPSTVTLLNTNETDQQKNAAPIHSIVVGRSLTMQPTTVIDLNPELNANKPSAVHKIMVLRSDHMSSVPIKIDSINISPAFIPRNPRQR